MSAFFGLDVGTSKVKVLQAEKAKQGLKLLNFASVAVRGKEVGLVIKEAMREAGIKRVGEVNVAFSESDVYTRIIQTPRLSETELASSIGYEAEQYVPVPLDEIELYHQVLSKKEEVNVKNTMEVLLIAVPKERIQKLMAILDQANLMPKSVETELFALKRIFADFKKSQLIISFGHKTTDLMLLDKGEPLFLHSFSSGGMALTKTLASEFNLPENQAEQYKRTYGLQEELLEGKVAKLLMPMIDEVIGQINKAFVYIQQQGGHKLPEQVVITGGGALTPGLGAYLVKKLNLEVTVGDPLTRFIKDKDFLKLMPAKVNPQLATVTGLALKGLI